MWVTFVVGYYLPMLGPFDCVKGPRRSFVSRARECGRGSRNEGKTRPTAVMLVCSGVSFVSYVDVRYYRIRGGSHQFFWVDWDLLEQISLFHMEQ